jgi:RadC-like JAB domain
MVHHLLPRAANDSACHPLSSGLADALSPLFQPYFMGLRFELAIAAGFDGRGRLLSFCGASGAANSNGALIPLVRAALRPCKVAMIVIAHNHADGDYRASATDIASTRRVAALCRLAGAELTDHFLFADDHMTSFRATGLI